jgi:hypothetical protein
VCGGRTNDIKQTGTYCFIGAGLLNVIGTTTGTAYSYIVGGDANSVQGAGSRSGIVGGDDNLVSGSVNSHVVGGLTNQIQTSNYSFIGGGRE